MPQPSWAGQVIIGYKLMSRKKRTKPRLSPERFIGSLILLFAVSMVLLLARIDLTDSFRYSFLFSNLILAAVPVLLAWWLVKRVRLLGWKNWQSAGLTVLWLVFLPNSFYLITDLIHLQPNYEADLLFDITLIMSFVISGLLLGFISVFMVHKELLARIGEKRAYWVMAMLFLVVSFAICLGRYSRWNTWDIVLRPAGLLFDVSDRLIYPVAHWQTYQTTAVLFALLFSTYFVLWEGARLIRGR